MSVGVWGGWVVGWIGDGLVMDDGRQALALCGLTGYELFGRSCSTTNLIAVRLRKHVTFSAILLSSLAGWRRKVSNDMKFKRSMGMICACVSAGDVGGAMCGSYSLTMLII